MHEHISNICRFSECHHPLSTAYYCLSTHCKLHCTQKTQMDAESKVTQNSFIMQIQTIEQKLPRNCTNRNVRMDSNETIFDDCHSTEIPYTTVPNTNVY